MQKSIRIVSNTSRNIEKFDQWRIGRGIEAQGKHRCPLQPEIFLLFSLKSEFELEAVSQSVVSEFESLSQFKSLGGS